MTLRAKFQFALIFAVLMDVVVYQILIFTRNLASRDTQHSIMHHYQIKSFVILAVLHQSM